jgi:hypothetical protein
MISCDISGGIAVVRTVISLEEDDKAWLDAEAARERLPMTELIRRAVSRLRAEKRPPGPSLEELLLQTRGLWKQADGLAWQRRLRAEWSR